MTQQYLVGELSQLLAELRNVAEDDPQLAQAVTGLRRETESLQPHMLAPVVTRALAVGDGLCWHSLTRGDAAAFSNQARRLHNLYLFGVCSGLTGE